MRKKVIVCVSMFLVLTLFSVFNFLAFSSQITGNVGSTGHITFAIMEERFMNITSPRNITYNFSKDDQNYTLPLNISHNLNDVDSWSYTLKDLKHDRMVGDSVSFMPNSSFDAVRWGNNLTVRAEREGGGMLKDSVQFFVWIPNTAPQIKNLSDELYVCEGEYLSSYFKSVDPDEDFLEYNIQPRDPFYVDPVSSQGQEEVLVEIFSGTIEKESARGPNPGYKRYEETVSIHDNYNESCCVDTKDINITAIEINNAPQVGEIGTKTVWTKGANSTFKYNVSVNDLEDGGRESEDINFSVSFNGKERLFDISNEGVINFSANNETPTGTYNVSVCATDSGISNTHENISLCNQDGGPLSGCENFSLTVTDRNRPPTITDYFPENTSLSVRGTSRLFFNVTKYDPDGTVPDTKWYVEGKMEEYDEGSVVDEFNHTFGCGVSGDKEIKVVVSDGLLNDSVTWNVYVELVECPQSKPPSSGGGVVGVSCEEKWACGSWHVCQNASRSLKEGVLARWNYRVVKNVCEEEGWDGRNCGVQVRECKDVNGCNTTYNKPREFKACYYSVEPGCNDGIRNCHDGMCELLIDCGGPCDPCPTCSDGIKNQGEEGIDCGGPCPSQCPVEKPLVGENWIPILAFVLANFILIVVIIVIVIRIFKLKKKIEMVKKE